MELHGPLCFLGPKDLAWSLQVLCEYELSGDGMGTRGHLVEPRGYKPSLLYPYSSGLSVLLSPAKG